MRLTRKFLLAMLAAILTIMVADGAVRLQRTARQLQASTWRQHEFTGRMVLAMYGAMAHEYGSVEAERIVRIGDRAYPSIDVRVVRLDDQDTVAERPRVALSTLASVARGNELHVRDARLFLSYLPALVPGQPARALELAEPAVGEAALVHGAIVQIATTNTVVVLTCSLLALWLGLSLVARPVELLVAKARKTGAGDLSGRIILRTRDELGELANEMNEMCDRLGAAQLSVAAETDARIAAIDQLRHADRLRTVGQLAAGVAHELGSPLNVVRGRAQLLRSGAVPASGVGDTARIIEEQTTRMAALIRQLLDFARQRGPQLQRIELAEVAGRAAALVAPLGTRRGVEVVVAPSATVETTADPTQIEQVVTNLVVNAIQACKERGRVTLNVGTRVARPPADVRDTTGPAVRWCVVDVADEGPGIAPELLPRLFEPFFTTKDVGEGTGLGLSIAYTIARDHGGWIGVESAVGEGSRFSLYLPIASASGLPANESASGIAGSDR